MRSRLLLPVIVSSLVTPVAVAVGDDDAAAIKRLIPSASAMSQRDFVKMATSATTPKESDFDDKSLTLLLFSLPIDLDVDEQRQQEFRYLTANGFPKPADLAAETYRGRRIDNVTIPLGPVTMIHADRITGCTANVDGDGATGTISFKVPQLYQGKVDYVARRKDGKWRIVQFTMSAHDINIKRSEDGKWKKMGAH